MTMKRYIFSEIQGNPSNDILAQGTLTVDNDNNLRLHDGSTNGGNIIGGGNANTGDVTFNGNIIQGNYGLNLAATPDDTGTSKYLRVRGGDQDSHIHFDTGNNGIYDLYLGDDDKYVRVSKDGEVVIGVGGAYEWNTNSGKRWTFNTDGNLVVAGNIQSSTTGDFEFTSNITGISLGSNEVYINLADSVFGDPYTGQVTISGVVGTTEANGVWYYEATDPNQFRIYNDVARTSPADGSSWTSYESGGTAVAVNQADLTISANNISVVAGSSDKTWTFNSDGTLTTPGYTLPATDGTAGQVLSTDGSGVVTWADAGSTTPASASYKGFKAIYGRMYGDEPTLSKLVIYKDSVSPTSSIDTSTNDDTFRVSGLTGSDVVVYFLLAGTDTSNPESLTTLQSFVEAAIDNVILDGGIEGNINSATDMKTAFYDNYSTLAATAGTLYENFEFLSTVSLNITNNNSTLVQGSGASIVLSDDGAGGYSVVSITNGGTNYRAGHKLFVEGALLDGTTGVHDALITVATADENGAITSATVTGTSFATAPVGGWEPENTNYNTGSGFTPYGLQYNPNDSTMQLNGWQNGNNYVVGDRIVILGTDIQNSNTSEYWASPANDVTILVTEVNGTSIQNYVISGNFPTLSGWPSYEINDGGDDQYDGGNRISTDLETNYIGYNNGDVASGSYAVGGGDYVAVYQSSIFGFFVSGAAISYIQTDGNSGFDGDGTADTGEIYGSGGSTDTPVVISWTNPNNNVWRIEEYNGGAGVSYNGSDYDAKWFDVADSTSGDGNFRGAIIQYHAYVSGEGNIIGTIHLANDYSQEAATHTEHLSGDSDLNFATLWQCNNERGQLYFKMTNGNSRDLLVQWTAKIFYGSENNC